MKRAGFGVSILAAIIALQKLGGADLEVVTAGVFEGLAGFLRHARGRGDIRFWDPVHTRGTIQRGKLFLCREFA